MKIMIKLSRKKNKQKDLWLKVSLFLLDFHFFYSSFPKHSYTFYVNNLPLEDYFRG